ncbi:MAG: hypothetical protein J3K34DRAFT_174962 [Monoraphidium minutum]|nr:MAG: hypothetical protein J3K34DRAFT_174962 [Monoraphidium minutum]
MDAYMRPPTPACASPLRRCPSPTLGRRAEPPWTPFLQNTGAKSVAPRTQVRSPLLQSSLLRRKAASRSRGGWVPAGGGPQLGRARDGGYGRRGRGPARLAYPSWKAPPRSAQAAPLPPPHTTTHARTHAFPEMGGTGNRWCAKQYSTKRRRRRRPRRAARRPRPTCVWAEAPRPAADNDPPPMRRPRPRPDPRYARKKRAARPRASAARRPLRGGRAAGRRRAPLVDLPIPRARAPVIPPAHLRATLAPPSGHTQRSARQRHAASACALSLRPRAAAGSTTSRLARATSLGPLPEAARTQPARAAGRQTRLRAPRPPPAARARRRCQRGRAPPRLAGGSDLRASSALSAGPTHPLQASYVEFLHRQGPRTRRAPRPGPFAPKPAELVIRPQQCPNLLPHCSRPAQGPRRRRLQRLPHSAMSVEDS